MLSRFEKRNPIRKEHWAIGLMLLFGLLHGLVYVFIVPPWQHYDEPGHFEHAWLIANRDTLPQVGDYDQAMRREVASSMIEHDFYRGLNMRPNLLSITEPIDIGISQLTDPHAYYWLVALPLRLVQTTDITFQLYIARIVSVLMYVITIAASYGLMADLTPPGHALRWILPLTLILLPSFSDMMSAINNDVGATACFSLFLWLSVRTLRKGPHWLRFSGILALSIACVLTKSTVFSVYLLAPIALLFAFIRRTRWQMIAWGFTAVGAMVMIGIGLEPGQPAFWYRDSASANAARVPKSDGYGSYAFELTPNQEGGQTSYIQPLSSQTAKQLSGKEASLGFWVWASQPTTIVSPMLSSRSQSNSILLQVTEQPQFFMFAIHFEENPMPVRISLPSASRAADGSEITIYYDAILLVEGDYTEAPSPPIVSADAQNGEWDGRPFVNLVRNGSAEQAWVSVRRSIDQPFANNYPATLSQIVMAIRDWDGARWYLESSAANLLRTFWAKFGWGHVPLIGQRPYRILVGISALGICAAVIAAWRQRHVLPWHEMFFLMLSGSLIWVAAYFRGVSSLLSTVFIPASRYALPAIIPTMLVFCFGWFAVGVWLNRQFKIPSYLYNSLYILGFLSLDILAFWSIVQFYAR
jgi:hypothetical protein